LPRILRETPPEFFENTKSLLAANADIVYDVLSQVPGLKPLRPQGAMYCMVGIDTKLHGEEEEFVRNLIKEER
jgi:tyrosine aminotransferase